MPGIQKVLNMHEYALEYLSNMSETEPKITVQAK